MIDWWLQPLDPQRAHFIADHVSWHARSMFLAWGALAPLGIIAARFFKILPGQNWPRELDSRAWWNWHRILQYGALFCLVVGLLLVLNATERQGASSVHFWLGWSVVALSGLQLISTLLRGSKGGPTAPALDGTWRGDHYDMTRRRVAFEYFHKTAGYLIVLIAGCAILAGLWQVNAPRWMWIVIGAWWVMLIATFVVLQRKGMATDSYDAIWGNDKRHPGLARPPIGFGVKRRSFNLPTESKD